MAHLLPKGNFSMQRLRRLPQLATDSGGGQVPPGMAVNFCNKVKHSSNAAPNFAVPPAFVVEQEHGAAKEVEEKTRHGDTCKISWVYLFLVIFVMDSGRHSVKQ